MKTTPENLYHLETALRRIRRENPEFDNERIWRSANADPALAPIFAGMHESQDVAALRARNTANGDSRSPTRTPLWPAGDPRGLMPGALLPPEMTPESKRQAGAKFLGHVREAMVARQIPYDLAWAAMAREENDLFVAMGGMGPEDGTAAARIGR